MQQVVKLYKASWRVALLATLEGAIVGNVDVLFRPKFCNHMEIAALGC